MEVCRTNYTSELIRFHAIIEKIKNQTIWLIFNFNCNLWQQVPETNKSKPASIEHLNYGHISPHHQHIFWLQNFGVLWYLLKQCGVYPRSETWKESKESSKGCVKRRICQRPSVTASVAPNDGFLPNALKTLFSLSKILLDL